MTEESKESLYVKLTQTRRLIVGPIDNTTRERLQAYATNLEDKPAAIEARDSAPPE